MFGLGLIVSVASLILYTNGTLLRSASSTKSHWELIAETRTFNNDPIQVYLSKISGLIIIIAQVEGPMVNGYFTIATEPRSNDGLPHTLEHLIFMGSEDYPYKGALDLLANRCLAQGTNAWTAADHTAYTVKTGGKEGFLNLLPVYLDHLLYPTLTNASFVTEVYHVTGQGEDAGVVYSEMQGRENTGNSLTFNEILRILYSIKSPYSYETGGLMANLRNSTSIEKIRKYHKSMYRPENLYLIITGQVKANDIFTRKDFKDFEDKIVSKGKRDPFVTPWRTPVPKLEATVEKEILYPNDKESTGLVRVAWRGPSIINNVEEVLALNVLFEYLTFSSVSPLEKAFVSTADPYASDVFSHQLKYLETSNILFFQGVPINKIPTVREHLTTTLNKIANDVTPLNITEIQDMIKKLILKEESKMETNPHGTIASNLILYALYGSSSTSYLNKAISQHAILQTLLTKDKQYWINLLNKYIINKPMAVVKGVPSKAKSKELQDEVKARVTKRKQTLGPKGLEKLNQIVQNATKINDIPPPDSMLRALPVASVRGISYHLLKVFSNINNLVNRDPVQGTPPVDFAKVPLKIELDDLNSNFVQIIAKLDTSHLSIEEKLYIPLLHELLLESSIQKEDGTVIPFTEVVKTLNAETIEASTLNGLAFTSKYLFNFGQYFSNVAVNIKVSIANYLKGMKWMRDILFNLKFEPSRVEVRANKILNSVEGNQSGGKNMVKLMYYRTLFQKDANVNRGNSLVQEKFLKQKLTNFKKDNATFVAKLNEVYKKLTGLDNISLHIASNFAKLSKSFDLTKSLQDFVHNKAKTSSMSLNVVKDKDQRTPITSTTSSARKNTGYVAGMGSVESGFLQQAVDSISDYDHPDLPALMIALSYLTQLEGPFWKHIRGQGLAYNYRINLRPQEGTLTLELNRASQLSRAYKVAFELLESYLNNTRPWDIVLFESGQSALVSQILAREEDIIDVVQQSILSIYRGVPHTYNRKLIEKISKTTFDEMKSAAQKHIKPLLDPKKSNMVIICPATKETEIKQYFDKFGHNLEVVTSLENSIFSEL